MVENLDICNFNQKTLKSNPLMNYLFSGKKITLNLNLRNCQSITFSQKKNKKDQLSQLYQ